MEGTEVVVLSHEFGEKCNTRAVGVGKLSS